MGLCEERFEGMLILVQPVDVGIQVGFSMWSLYQGNT